MKNKDIGTNEQISQESIGLLTVQELALRIKVPPATIYYWVAKRSCPVQRFGRHLRFNLAEVTRHFQLLHAARAEGGDQS